MLAVNYTNFRENMKDYMDKATNDYETMIVTRKDNKNVVMLSEEAYNNLMENVYVMGNKANYDWLMESKEQPALVSELNNVLFPTFGKPTIPNFILSFTCSKILKLSGFSPFYVILLNNFSCKFLSCIKLFSAMLAKGA